MSGNLLFQLTPPHKGRRPILLDLHLLWEFQLTPPHKGRPMRARYQITTVEFQLTPPHKGRRTALGVPTVLFWVSTHAPA